MRAIAKLRHPNLVKVRGFSWGKDEKLVICDYVPNGSLASIGYSKFTRPHNFAFCLDFHIFFSTMFLFSISIN